ncbi:ATP-binding cassette domain-containing protein [Actinosynnema sp. CS-041913]|uniref:ATP-binding cassette domain-containing protein n=1 Tax=Actinosynnema sp. CS-041913 TaxID=3239917 RepID=UPI003D8BA944
MQLFSLFFVLPTVGIELSPLMTGAVGLGVHYATYTSEVYPAGIDGVPAGQWEAAKALSLSRRRTWTRVVLPQAVPRVVPALGNYSFDGVSKRFGATVVLDDLSFDVRAGERVTLIGPSGSGKTTILRMLMTLTAPHHGMIILGGTPLFHEQRGDTLVPAGEQHLRAMRRHTTMVFQQYNLFPNMRVLRNVTEAPVHVLGLSRDEADERARELLDLVGLADKLDAYPSRLSGGRQHAPPAELFDSPRHDRTKAFLRSVIDET